MESSSVHAIKTVHVGACNIHYPEKSTMMRFTQNMDWNVINNADLNLNCIYQFDESL